MTTRPTIGLNRSDGDIVTAADYNRDVIQNGNWAQEVMLGSNADKIPAAAISGSVGYYPNILVNGGMEVCQRFAPNTNQTITTSGVVVLDRWVGLITGAAAMTVGQSNAAADVGSQYSAYMHYTHAASQVGYIYQKVENYQEYKGKTVSVSARVYASVNLAGYLTVTDGVTTVNSPRVVAVGGFYTVTVVFPVSLSATLLQVSILADATTDFYVDNVMMALSPTPIDYIQRPNAEELLLCRRYYQKFGTTTRWRAGVAGEFRDTGIIWQTPMAGTPTTTLAAGSRSNISGTPSVLSIDSNGCRIEYAATTNTDTFAVGDTLEAVYNV